MTYMHKFEIDEHRAALIFRHFDRIHMRIIGSGIADIKGETEPMNIGDPYEVSMKTEIGLIEDSKYTIRLDWLLLITLMCGELQRFVVDVKRKICDGDLTHTLIVEHSDGNYCGAFYSEQETFLPTFNADELVAHILLKDIEEYPSVHRREN